MFTDTVVSSFFVLFFVFLHRSVGVITRAQSTFTDAAVGYFNFSADIADRTQ